MLFSPCEISWDFLVRLHAFKQLCDFLLILFFCRYEISCLWLHILFKYTSLQSHHGILVSQFEFLRTTSWTWHNSCSSDSRDRFGGSGWWRGGDAKACMRVGSGEGAWWNMLRKGVMLFGHDEISWWDFMLFGSLWDFFMRSHAFYCRIFLRDLLKRLLALLPLWDAREMLFALCEISLWDCAVTSFAYENACLLGRHAMSWWDYMLFGCRIFFLMVWCKDGGEVDVKGCGRLSVLDDLLDVAWFYVCKFCGSLAG